MKTPNRSDREANPPEIASAVDIILEESGENGLENLAALLTRMPWIRNKLHGESVIVLNELGRGGRER